MFPHRRWARGIYEVADLRGDRRLAEAELLRRLGDAAQAGDHVEGFQLGEGHDGYGSRCGSPSKEREKTLQLGRDRTSVNHDRQIDLQRL